MTTTVVEVSGLRLCYGTASRRALLELLRPILFPTAAELRRAARVFAQVAAGLELNELAEANPSQVVADVLCIVDEAFCVPDIGELVAALSADERERAVDYAVALCRASICMESEIPKMPDCVLRIYQQLKEERA